MTVLLLSLFSLKYIISIYWLVRALHTIYVQAFARRQIHKTEFSSRASLRFHIFEQYIHMSNRLSVSNFIRTAQNHSKYCSISVQTAVFLQLLNRINQIIFLNFLISCYFLYCSFFRKRFLFPDDLTGLGSVRHVTGNSDTVGVL